MRLTGMHTLHILWHIKEVFNMRATLNIPDDLIAEVQQILGQKSKTNAIITVMKEYVRRQKMQALLDLRGKVKVDYDWAQEETLELKAAEEREQHHGK
jgi:Arc/MetJ family transcription regulator